MIKKFKLKFGSGPSAEPTDIEASPITLFVGPNNSGKSRVLSEIAHYCQTGMKHPYALILDVIEFSGVSHEALDNVIEQITVPLPPGQTITEGTTLIRSRNTTLQIASDQLRRVLQNPALDANFFSQWFLATRTLILNGTNRLNLLNEQQGGDLQAPAQSSFQTLFRDNAKRRDVRRIVAEAIGTYFVVDFTNLGILRIRLSDREPETESEERGINNDAIKFHAAALPISETSDGIKAFVGVITELIAGDPSVLLIDEPEAFLHPSLASKMGLEVSRLALSTQKKVFASTHSPAFLMGCIQSGAPVTIIRLTYRGGIATSRTLASDEILKLMRHPLLRSTGVLSSLFYEFVVVVESDSDRAFYQEINERLLQFRPEWGIPHCLFINAQNKQTIHTILRPLRQMGIPAAAIVDIDVLKNGGSEWSNLLNSASLPTISQEPLTSLKNAVKRAMDETGRDMKRDGGINILPATDQEAAGNLLMQLANYGIFVVPGGELESWVSELGATGHGPSWLINVFEKMGENPEDTAYLRPSDDDIWKFMSQVRCWLINPSRAGIPS